MPYVRVHRFFPSLCCNLKKLFFLLNKKRSSSEFWWWSFFPFQADFRETLQRGGRSGAKGESYHLPKCQSFSRWAHVTSATGAVAEAWGAHFCFWISVVVACFHCWTLSSVCRKSLCAREWGSKPNSGGSPLHSLLPRQPAGEQVSVSKGDRLKEQWSGWIFGKVLVYW